MSLSAWHATFIDLCVLSYPCFPGMKPIVIVMRYPFDLFLNLVRNFKKFICALCVWDVPVPWLMEEGSHKDEFSSFLSICWWVDGYVPRLGNKLISIEPYHESLQISFGHFYNHVKLVYNLHVCFQLWHLNNTGFLKSLEMFLPSCSMEEFEKCWSWVLWEGRVKFPSELIWA